MKSPRWNLRLKSARTIRAELDATERLLQAHGYTAPIPFRSPFGYSWLVLPLVLKQRHQANILWTVQVNDWKPDPVAAMMQRLEAAWPPGAIILLHDGDGRFVGGDRSNTVKLVQQILEKYVPQGYQFVTVSELLKRG